MLHGPEGRMPTHVVARAHVFQRLTNAAAADDGDWLRAGTNMILAQAG